jgi:hypothetical protein
MSDNPQTTKCHWTTDVLGWAIIVGILLIGLAACDDHTPGWPCDMTTVKSCCMDLCVEDIEDQNSGCNNLTYDDCDSWCDPKLHTLGIQKESETWCPTKQ